MNLYIFIRPSAAGVGGSLIYTENKIKYLKKHGWDVVYFHANLHNNDFQIEGLNEYAKCYDERMHLPAYMYFEKDKLFVYEELKKIIKPIKYDSIIIESETISLSTWGEYFAQKLNAIHIIYLLAEKNEISSRFVFKYLWFKFLNNELFGITSKSIPYLFDTWKAVEEKKAPYLRAAYSLSVDDVDYKYHFRRDSVKICSIGRLDKPFVIHALRDLKEFILKESFVSYDIVLIGDGSELIKKEINNLFEDIDNVNILITGNLYPLPYKLLMKMNVFISSAGSCRVSGKMGKLTIAYDGRDFKPIGIYGITTNNTIFRDEKDKVQSLSFWLDEILKRKRYKEEINTNYLKDNEVDFSEHLGVIKKVNNLGTYYNFPIVTRPIKLIIKSVLLYMVGFDNYSKIVKMKRKY